MAVDLCCHGKMAWMQKGIDWYTHWVYSLNHRELLCSLTNEHRNRLMNTPEKLRDLKPYWLLDEGDKDDFKHYLSQFITACCPNCGSRKIFVDGNEQTVLLDGKAQLLAAYYAVCDECSHVWCRAASPDLVVDQCLAQTAELDIKDMLVPLHALAKSPCNVREDGETFEQKVAELGKTRPYLQPIANVSHASKQEK